MGKFIDLTGQKFGRLVVIKRAANTKNNCAHWLCKCDCGNEKVILSSSLIQGNTKSCGCLAKESSKKRMTEMRNPDKLSKGEAEFNRIYAYLKRNAKRRDLTFRLTKDEVGNLTSRNCHYCNSPPEQRYTKARANGGYKRNGIDRYDNDVGYIIENCVPCCWTCNRFKGSRNGDEFLALIERIHNYHKSNKLKVI